MTTEDFIAVGHPTRRVRALVDEVLVALSPQLTAMYAPDGRYSVPPEHLIKASLLMALYSIRSERQFCERLQYDLLFKWFLGLNITDDAFDHSTFSKNRKRLLEHDVAGRFMQAVLEEAQRRRLLSEEHFTVDGTLMEAWASLKSFRPRDDKDPPCGRGAEPRARTYESYAGLLRLHVIPTLGGLKLAKVSPLHVQRLLNERLESGLSATTVERIRDVLRNALNQAVKWDLVARNVAQLADPPKVEARELTPWTVEQARSFLHAVREDRLTAAFLIGAVTGMRRGELLGLRWDDVDLEAGVIEIRGSVQRIKGQGIVRAAPKTAASRRKLAIASFICNALTVHRERQLGERSMAGSKWVESGYVFTSSTGTAMDPRNLTRRFQALAEAAGVPKQRFHDLRHFAASVQLMDGAPLNAVQQQLGHSKASTTLDIYAHVSHVVHRERAERMSDLISEGLDLTDSNCPPNCPPEGLEEVDTDVRQAI